jgi:hypothetical protein
MTMNAREHLQKAISVLQEISDIEPAKFCDDELASIEVHDALEKINDHINAAIDEVERALDLLG